MSNQRVIERAFQIARSSECLNLTELSKKLRQEGFSHVDEHLSGAGTRKQLRVLIAASRDQQSAA